MAGTWQTTVGFAREKGHPFVELDPFLGARRDARCLHALFLLPVSRLRRPNVDSGERGRWSIMPSRSRLDIRVRYLSTLDMLTGAVVCCRRAEIC